MAEVILRDGLTDLTISPEEGAYVEVVAGIPIRFTYHVPTELGSPDWIACYIGQSNQGVDPYPFELLAELPFINWIPAGYTYEILLEPTKPYVRCRFVTSASMNFGAVTVIGVYETMPEAVYNHLMAGKAKLDKVLARVSRQKTQLQEKITEGDATETEILEGAYQLYTNFLSDEIAAYEALNP